MNSGLFYENDFWFINWNFSWKLPVLKFWGGDVRVSCIMSE